MRMKVIEKVVNQKRLLLFWFMIAKMTLNSLHLITVQAMNLSKIRGNIIVDLKPQYLKFSEFLNLMRNIKYS